MVTDAVPSEFRSCISSDGATVSIVNRGLKSIPKWLRNYTSITALYLSGNQLAKLPAWLGNLTSLTMLYLSSNRLADLPEWLGNLSSLTRFGVGGNQLTTLPEWLRNFSSLTVLGAGGNHLTTLPEWLGDLTALTSLDLRDNQLTSLPESLGNLTALSTLDLRNNQLTELPESVGNLRTLATFSIGGNQLIELPESAGNLVSLTTLDLYDNRLTSLPESLGNLTSLANLDLCKNRLTRLPRTFADLLRDELKLDLKENPLGDPLPELVNRGFEALAVYLRSLDDAIALYEAKLLLVGEGNVGKTSLAAALRGAPFVKDRPTTHGIEIWPLAFHHPSLDLDMTLRAWDFGGQEVYRVTHQFFFSRRALYVVVWNAREGHEQDQAEGWLRRIRLRVGRDVRAMVVATHCEERLPDLDYRHLESVFPDMLAGSFEVDNRTGFGLAELRQAISRQAARLPQMGQEISHRWLAARDEILALAQAEPQIRYERFAKICKRHGVVGDEIVTLAELMHDLGHVIYYSEDEGLRDIVVLNPEWLTKAISYVLEDKHTKEAGGVLDHARLKSIWQARKDGQAYSARYHPYFLRLMEKFDVSYRLEGDELHSLVAQLVQHERPVLPWQSRTQAPPGMRVLTLVCRLSEPAPGLIPWLTVRHQRASTGLHWRRGVFLRHPITAYASEAVVELISSNELIVEVRAPSPDLYFNVLRDSIEDLITRRWPGLTYRLLIPCPGKSGNGSACPGQFPLDGLLLLREHGLTTYPCVECAKVHELSLLLTGFTLPDQPLIEKLDRMHDQLNRLESNAAEAAESIRRILRAISTEVTDCPRLFTIESESSSRHAKLQVYRDRYRLTLWCEHPGYWHPSPAASYKLDKPKEWFAQISPYAIVIFRTLQLVVPLAGSAVNALLPPDQLIAAKNYLQLMGALVKDLPAQPPRNQTESSTTEIIGQLTTAEGQALRALRAVLFERDRSRAFGGLRRVQAPSGDFLWVCPDHYPEYDPGLPTVP
jgi:internalin A